jgi:hypothetical protein
MKIYTLVRREFNQEIQLWHYAKIEAAQDAMLYMCSNRVGGAALQLNSEGIAKGWKYEIGETYATISDGNAVDYDIIEDDIETYDFLVQQIIDRIALSYTLNLDQCETIEKVLGNMDKTKFPCLDNRISIDEFIKNEFTDEMARLTTNVVCKGISNEETRNICCDTIKECYGFNIMTKAIDHDYYVVKQIRSYLAEKFKIKEFMKECFWVCTYGYKHGEHFDANYAAEIYKNHDSAHIAMSSHQAEALEEMACYYERESLHCEEKDECFMVSDKYKHDLWEGKIELKFIED